MRENHRQQRRRQINKVRPSVLIRWAAIGAAVALVPIVILLGYVVSGSSGSSGEGNAGNYARFDDSGAAAFSVKTAAWSGGQPFVLAENPGKPTILFFMASWCVTCASETKVLARLHREYGDRVNILALDMDPVDSEDSLWDFKNLTEGGDHLWAMDDGALLSQAFGVRALGTTIILDSGGREVYRDAVPTSYDKLKSELGKLL